MVEVGQPSSFSRGGSSVGRRFFLPRDVSLVHAVDRERVDQSNRDSVPGGAGAGGAVLLPVPPVAQWITRLGVGVRGSLRYAMDHMPDEHRYYLDEPYAAYGIVDRDPLHQRALLKFFAEAPIEGTRVVDGSKLYARTSNAQWYLGQPAMKWTASAGKIEGRPNGAEVVVGWLHSEHLNQVTTYILEYDGDSWSVVDVELLDEAQRALRAR